MKRVFFTLLTFILPLSAFSFDGMQTIVCPGKNSTITNIRIFDNTSNVTPAVTNVFAIITKTEINAGKTLTSSYVLPQGKFTYSFDDKGRATFRDSPNSVEYVDCVSSGFEAFLDKP